MTIFYFDIKHALREHDKLLKLDGGLSGEPNIGLLESPLIHIQNNDYYPNFEDKLTHLVYCVVKDHPFNDANKRSGLILGGYFLEINGYDYCVNKFFKEMENIEVSLAQGDINKELLQKIITSIIFETEFPESLKLEIIDAIS